MKCLYNFTFLPDSSNPKNIGKDLMVLEIGKKSSLFYSYYHHLGDSLFNDDSKKGVLDNSKDDGGKYYTSFIAYNIATNFPANQITFTDRLSLIYNYKYSEPLISQDWEIMPDTAIISNVKCQKAVTVFRGRKYVAWFSKDIPITYGPWKFFGLPGLIVKISDTKNNFVYELLKIESVKSVTPMSIFRSSTMFNDNKYVETSRKEFLELKKLSFEDPIGFFEANSGSFEIKVDMSPEERKAKSRPYNPMELE
jgi:GLPGLI family protein